MRSAPLEYIPLLPQNIQDILESEATLDDSVFNSVSILRGNNFKTIYLHQPNLRVYALTLFCTTEKLFSKINVQIVSEKS